MQSLVSKILHVFLFIVALDARYSSTAVKSGLPNCVYSTIVVDKNGLGDFTAVQQAIDSIPSHNLVWTRIFINYGDPNGLTTIEYGDAGNVVESPTFKLQEDNFMARYITFKNTYNTLLEVMDFATRKVRWAPAAAVAGDKASFYQCYKLHLGQWTVNVREVPDQFNNIKNRPWGLHYSSGSPCRNHSRVLFAGTYMDDIIAPEGWKLPSWSVGSEDLITFSEEKCSGPGANMSNRVEWEKQLSDQVINLTNTTYFISQEGWMDEQPN
ncbi:hypothetical protein M0R45_028549 [Rubus argutus]|uniref:pectinesterase n=1 Tax=Rubus argutus TaxID=59490 RepID=A0AAW1W920_RUBAR